MSDQGWDEWAYDGLASGASYISEAAGEGVEHTQAAFKQGYTETAEFVSGENYTAEQMQTWSLHEIATYIKQDAERGGSKNQSKHLGVFFDKYYTRLYGGDGNSGAQGSQGAVPKMVESIDKLSKRALNWSREDWESIFQ